jgi:hypothetical protein
VVRAPLINGEFGKPVRILVVPQFEIYCP